MDQKKVLLQIDHLSVNYQLEQTNTLALDRVSVVLPYRGTLGIVGESGSGKTTLGMSIMNYVEPPGMITSGSIKYQEKNLLQMTQKDLRRYRWEEVSMIFQSAMNSLNPVKKIIHPIVEVLQSHKHISKKEATEIATRLLSEVGIKSDRAFDYPHEFSGGMRQRVVIALAVALSPKLLIADEPTSALDVVTQKQILSLVKEEIEKRNLSLIFITHEISLLPSIVDQIAVMYSGEIVEHGSLRKVITEPLHPYTEMLLSTVLSMRSTVDDLIQFTKSASKGRNFSVSLTGCKYANRCKYAFDRCTKERPLLKDAGNGRLVACHKYD